MHNIKQFFNYPKSTYLLIALSFAGAALSLYMYDISLGLDKGGLVPCTPDGGCENVLSSSYSEIFGLPIAFWGIVYYLGVALVLTLRRWTKIAYTQLTFKVSIVWGIVFTLYLRYLEHFIIKDYCALCWLSVVILALIVIVYNLESYPKSTKIK